MTSENMTDMEKLAHLLGHWQEHNDQHAAGYDSWAEKAEAAGRTEAARLLKEAGRMTLELNQVFQKALESLES